MRAKTMVVEGHRQYNPGWHLALDLRNMLIVSECIAKAALAREESRGGHTRDDFPGPNAEWGTKNLVVNLNAEGTGVDLHEKPLPEMPDELKGYFERVTGYTLKLRIWRGDKDGGEIKDYPGRGLRGRGRARRDPPRAGHPGRRPRRAVELQGRQVRLVQRRGQRQARG